MTLGDSITNGLGYYGYRPVLDQQLHAAGLTPTFVGSQSDGTYREEGHSGYAISDIAANVDNWIAAAHPDVITLMIGTNDVDSYGHGTPNGAADRLHGLIDQITADAPNAKLIVGSIPANLAGGPVDAYNAAMPGIVAAEQAQGKHVYFADVHAATSVSDLVDGVHPDNAGQAKIGAAFASATVDALHGTITAATASVEAPAAPAPQPAAADPSSTGQQMTLHVAGDHWLDDAQFTVALDGQQVGGTFAASAVHAAGQWQDVTLNLGAVDASQAHDLSISFANDASNGTQGADRNLYVGGLEVNGHHVDGNAASAAPDPLDPNAAALLGNGSVTYHLGSDYWHNA
jgi:lysophospholipase L1-like esterase